ncbi:hypothetical protein [Clostridioides difficile]|uniref:hypothetical protein n=1 Tax=Clostridioides difficile TaxID=1496 RepID=UPI001C18B238|nr:hypothetical protein [Clostridioides difficile]MCU5872612.1 hypothetical protein [Clostridioides difficile]MCU5898934.1 hypothetical protein [Clostridioides difficile]HBF6217995.1 hypothetical protein [Clostridioides difficile]HBF6482962.1 hypothetical protein [Clostridioides difficile]HBF6528957.1 hypothetical protein [Clostridioides difficile]
MNSNKKRITVRMPEKLNEGITKKSKYLGLTKNSFILDILWKEFELLEYRSYKKEVDKHE